MSRIITVKFSVGSKAISAATKKAHPGITEDHLFYMLKIANTKLEIEGISPGNLVVSKNAISCPLAYWELVRKAVPALSMIQSKYAESNRTKLKKDLWNSSKTVKITFAKKDTENAAD
jgi:hypothetical protein